MAPPPPPAMAPPPPPAMAPPPPPAMAPASSVSVRSSSSSMMSSSSSASSSSLDESISASDRDQEDRYHPAHEEEKECKYTGEFGDCDPFKMIKIKEERLLTGPATCEDKKNTTKPCHRSDFPPGTMWLLKEHKLCVQELQKLKTMIEDLHRYIDLIHQRGQALFNAYNDMRKKLGDVRNEIAIIGRKNHDAEQTIKRLRVELEDWKSQNNKMQEELSQVKAQAEEMERKVEESKAENQQLTDTKEALVTEGRALTVKLDKLMALNKELKVSLLDVERYKEEFREVSEFVDMIKRKIKEVQAEIKKTKEELNAARLEGVMPKTKYYAPKFNKDTKVNLDMSMWITHNISKEEREPYKPKIEYYEQPYTTYKPKYEEPKYETTKYEEPKYETPKYEEPASEAPKYEEPKYEEKYEESDESEEEEEKKYIDVPK